MSATAWVLLGALVTFFVRTSTSLVVPRSPRALYSASSYHGVRWPGNPQYTTGQPVRASSKSCSNLQMVLDIPATAIQIGAAVGVAIGVTTVLRGRGGGKARSSSEADDLRRYNEILGRLGANKAPSPRPSPRPSASSSPPPRTSDPAPRPMAVSSSDLLDDAISLVDRPAAPPPPAPSPAPAPPAPKKKSGGLGLFKRSPGRPTDLETVLDGATDREFAEQLTSSLAGAVASGRFDDFLVTFEVEGGSDTDALSALMASKGLAPQEVAEIIAGAVNAMLIPLIDEAVEASSGGGKGGEEAAMEALTSLKGFMAHAGGLFEALAAGADIKPVKYSGKTSKAKLEDLFTKYVTRQAQDAESAIDGDSVDNLQRVLGIKDSKADQIGQKVMMDSMMEMMKEEGGAEDMAALTEMMGGAPPSEGQGTAGLPGDMQTMIDVLKETLDASLEDRAEVVRELDKTFGAMGMSLEQMIDVMSAQPDPKAKELVGLFKQLKDPNFKPRPAVPAKPTEDDLLGL